MEYINSIFSAFPVVAPRIVDVVSDGVELCLQGGEPFGGFGTPRGFAIVDGVLGAHVGGREVGHHYVGSREYALDTSLGNKEFQDLLATRLATLLEGPLSDENMVKTIREIAAVIRPETQWEEQRWGTPVKGWRQGGQWG